MDPIRLLIIGGVAGGATAAARARRINEKAEIILFDRGEYISFANCGLPYYLGGVIKRRNDLLVTDRKAFGDRYQIDVRIFHEVLAIDRDQKCLRVKDIISGTIIYERYDKLILSPGAEPVKPPLDGIESDKIFTLRNIPDSDRIKAFIAANKPTSAVIVGGGYIGLEMAENLANHGVKTTIIEMLNQVMAPLDFDMASLVHRHLKEKGVSCELGKGVSSFSEDKGRIVVTTDNGDQFVSDFVIMSAGIRPENRLAREAGLEIGKMGGIQVDKFLKTSDPDIYAVGDAVEVNDRTTNRSVITALAGPANKQARIAADNVMGRKSVFKGTIGTAIVKIFDLTVAATGASEKKLKENNIPYLTSYTHEGSHATYYPDSKMMAIKLTFSPEKGNILGAQIIGLSGVDKRIDIVATAIHGSMTVFDLEELELAYAPPYSSAKDPINMAGFVAANILRGDLDITTWDELSHLERGPDVLMDLRTPPELRATGVIPGSVHIPLDRLRHNMEGFDRKKRYITYCAVGMRSYVAHRILTQNGFQSKILSGGMTTYVGSGNKTEKIS